MKVDKVQSASFSGSVAGSGNLAIGMLRADSATLGIAGSGDASVTGEAKSLDITIAGSGDLDFDIVPGHADQSILVYRMRSTKIDEMMPELGRAVVHEEGVSLVESWINQLPGSCGAP